MAQKPAIAQSRTIASAPPVITTSAALRLINSAASPIACVPVAQAVEMVLFGPRHWNLWAIEYAGILGMETRYLGVLLTWQELVAACRSFRPDYLGLTLLQLDSEDDVIALRKQVPAQVKIIAGGPVFKLDADLRERAGIDVVAKDLTAFLRFCLETATSP